MRNMKSDYTTAAILRRTLYYTPLGDASAKRHSAFVPAKHAVQTVFLANLMA
jgi:hypothetical protein